MNRPRKHQVWEAGWTGAGQLGGALGALASVVALTQLLPPAAYGELALALTVATLAQQIVYSPVSAAAMRFLPPALESGSAKEYARAAGAMMRRANASTAVVSLLGAGVSVSLGQERIALLILLAAAFAAATGTQTVVGGVQSARRRRKVVALHQIASAALRVFFTVVALLLLGGGSASAMLGLIAAEVLVLVSQVAFLRRDATTWNSERATSSSRKLASDMTAYARPFFIWGIFSSAHMASDRYALALTRNAGAVGEYAVLMQLGFYPLSVLSAALTLLISPVLFERAGDALDVERTRLTVLTVRRVARAFIAATALLTAAATILGGTALAMIAPPEYAAVGRLLPFAVIAGGLFGAGQVAALGPMVAGQSSMLILPKIVTSLGFALATFPLAATYGVEGVTVGLCVYTSAYALWTYLLCGRVGT